MVSLIFLALFRIVTIGWSMSHLLDGVFEQSNVPVGRILFIFINFLSLSVLVVVTLSVLSVAGYWPNWSGWVGWVAVLLHLSAIAKSAVYPWNRIYLPLTVPLALLAIYIVFWHDAVV